MANPKRNISGNSVIDPSAIANFQYNDASGAEKNMEVGRHLLPLNSDGTTLTCNATTAIALPGMGKNLAVYNNSGSLGTITLGSDGTVTSQSAGVVDANGNPGIPCKGNDWTYIACKDKKFVIASASTLLVFLIDDESSIKPETTR